MEFSAVVADFWRNRFSGGEIVYRDDAFLLAIDPALPADQRGMVLDVVDGPVSVVLDPTLAALLDLDRRPIRHEAAFRTALRGAAIHLHGADHLFYFAAGEREAVLREQPGGDIRRLTSDDAAAFAEFQAAAAAQDRDDAFVELDHWTVSGAFVEERLACAASAYPWQHGRLADIGVLTLAPFRGRGLARGVVRAISHDVLVDGYEPQYRCQFGHDASVAVARAAGLTRFGSWEVVPVRTAC